jgi:predicted ABC-type ATPase
LCVLRLRASRALRNATNNLSSPSPEDALKPVARRVREGGHGVPEEIVGRRYVAGLRNLLALYLRAVDLAMIFDNSDEGRVIIAEWIMGTGLVVRDRARWARIEEAAT